MADRNQDVEIWQGQDVNLDFTITGVDVTTGAEISYGISFSAKDTTALVSKTKTGGQITTPDGTSVIVQIDASDTSPLSPRDYFHELWIEDSVGNVVPLADGTLTVLGSTLK